jgi:hypothetical protein
MLNIICLSQIFQACLHLDISGNVVLTQGSDDVLVRAKD